MYPRLFLSVLLVAALPALPVRAAEPVLFETHILPILETRCLKCHGQDKTRGGLDVRRRFALIRGGDGGTALVPGKPDESSLVKRIEQNEMPPPEEGKLT